MIEIVRTDAPTLAPLVAGVLLVGAGRSVDAPADLGFGTAESDQRHSTAPHPALE